jgi:putative ABC transport system ATP-binding protein
MLRLEEASKSYGKVTALRPTTLTITKGEYVAVVGSSGSGKSTLLGLLGAMSAPTQGKVFFEDHSVYDLSAAERAKLRGAKIGFVFQSFHLVSWLTALENVEMALMLNGHPPKQQRERAEFLLKRVGLGERATHRPGELSVGQQQRVALARTLANDPALILADEPTGNLDPTTRESVLSLFDDFHDEGRTIIVVTHDPAVASRASRVLRLEEGSISALSTFVSSDVSTNISNPVSPSESLQREAS